MASADYSVGTKVTADVSNFEKGMNKAEKSLKGFSDKLADNINRLGKKGLVGSLGSVGLALGGITSAVGIATKAFKKVSQAIGECTEAYKVQYKAEVALETVAKNNPYVDGTGVKALKQFASEIQSVSNYGDEELLPLISNLTALGRTESETMDIIRVATDMASTGMMSLDTAVNQLNATLNGNIGRLGLQNAELKGLSEEELKNGKAVEILGNKYKGLSQATVDTSKQLKNAVGDFKELIGESFEKALAPMRKYFAELITHVNDAIKSARQQKEAFDDVFKDGGFNADAETENMSVALDKVLAEYREVYQNQKQYLQLYGAYIDQETDETAKAYKERISELSKQIKQLSEELVKRRKESDKESKAREERNKQAETEKEINDLKEKYLKKIAEQEAKWANIKKVTGEAVKNEERLKFYQEQLVAIMTESGGKITENNQYYKDQMAIIQGILAEIGNPEKQTEWANKLLDQRIEMLETERDRAMELAEEEGQEVYSIQRYYNEKILALKLQQIEKEREEALKGENVTADAKIAINEYYDNEVKKVYDDLGKYKKAKKKEEVKEEKKSFDQMLEIAKQYAENIAGIFSKISGIAKTVFSKIVSLSKSIFSFNVDDALTNLLKFEDSVLTFFVETLPKLPDFFASAMQSIFVLLNNVSNILLNNSDAIINNLTVLVKNIINGIANWVTSGGWQDILNALLVIQTAIENAIADNMEEIANTIREMLPALIDFLVKSISSASKTLGKIAKVLLPLIADLILAIIEVITSDEVLESSFEAVEGLVDGLVQAIIKLLTKAVPKIINFLIKIMANPSTLIKLTVAIVKGLIRAFAKTDWKQVVEDIFMAFIDAFKNLFGIHSPSTLFEGFGMNMVDGLVSGLQGISDAVNTILEPLYKLVTDVFGGIGDFINTSLSVSFQGLSDILNSSGSAFAKITNSVANLVKQLKNLIKAVNNATSALFGGGAGGGLDAGDVVTAILTGGVSLLFRHAKGTNNAQKGLSLVGEAGPELVRFNGGEQVLNSHNTEKALANMGGNTNNFNVTFNNLQDTTAFRMMQQLKAYNRQMAINGVI